MLTYQVEDWSDIKDDMRGLWPVHWNESAPDKDTVQLNLDEDQFDLMAQLGQLHCVTVRDSESCGQCVSCDKSQQGKIVGYHISILRPHLHRKAMLIAFVDAYFLHPDYRQGMNGVKLFRKAEEFLAGVGVVKIQSETKIHNDKSPVFEFLDYKKTAVVYTKTIGVNNG